MRLILLSLVASAVAFAQSPYIAYRGVFNVASYMPPGLSASGIAQGSTFAIFGSSLGPASTPPLAFPLNTTLGGVSITIKQGNTTVNAIPVGLTAGQVNAIMPSNAPLGAASLQLSYNGFKSNSVPIQIVTSSFGIFTANSVGNGPGIFQKVAGNTLPINSLQTSVGPGTTVILWGTGLGPATFPDNVAPTAVNLATQTEVFVGGVKADLQYNGRSGCCSGIDQLVFKVPAAAPLGCWVPVYVRTGGTTVSNMVTMAISSDGNTPCKEPNNKLASALINGGKIASYAAAHFTVRQDVAIRSPLEAVTDVLGGFQAQEAKGEFNFNPMFSLPPAGTCTTYSVIGDLTSNDNAIIPGMTPPSGRGGAGLNAGTVTISGGKGTKTAQQSTAYPAMSGAPLAGSVPALTSLTNTSFLDPGVFSLMLGGGADIGSASTTFNQPSPFTWTNRDQLTTVTRSLGVPVSWTGGDPNASVLIAGMGADLPSNSTEIFLCVAPTGANNFTVPADILANLPVAKARAIQSKGAIYVAQWNIATPATLGASGLDYSAIVPASISGKTVSWK